jgi:3-oxoacyl-[acyl-carrier-protein] synthase-3
MIHTRVSGTGGYLPGEPIGNADLIERYKLDSTDEWIVERTGIRTRHLAAAGVASSDLALEASRRALQAAGCEANDLDLIIVATSTPDFVFPSTAALLQHKLGNNNGAAAFDVQAVCSGFVYAMTIAEKFIRSGSHKRALVVGAEVFSRILDWTDRGTCVLFGDGAGAVVLEAADEPGILASAFHADGSHHGILSVPGQVCGGTVTGDPFLRMDGQAVFKFAVRVLAEVAHEVLDAAGMTDDAGGLADSPPGQCAHPAIDGEKAPPGAGKLHRHGGGTRQHLGGLDTAGLRCGGARRPHHARPAPAAGRRRWRFHLGRGPAQILIGHFI